MDSKSKNILMNIISSRLFATEWGAFSHFLTFFESIDGYTQIAFGTGAVTIDGTGVQLTTGTTSANSTQLIKNPVNQNFLTFAYQSFFRTAFQFTVGGGVITAFSAYYGIGIHTGDFYGFKIASGHLYGCTRLASTETLVQIITTVVVSTIYDLEARYYPADRVDFLIGGILVGSLNKTLPNNYATSNQNFLEVFLATGENASKVLSTSFFEYVQARNIKKY